MTTRRPRPLGRRIAPPTTKRFLGDCGLTWQPLDGRKVLEVGYHVVRSAQGQGYATEAAHACLRLAVDRLGATYVTAIINPANQPSRRVAEKIGMILERDAEVNSTPVVVYSHTVGERTDVTRR